MSHDSYLFRNAPHRGNSTSPGGKIYRVSSCVTVSLPECLSMSRSLRSRFAPTKTTMLRSSEFIYAAQLRWWHPARVQNKTSLVDQVLSPKQRVILFSASSLGQEREFLGGFVVSSVPVFQLRVLVVFYMVFEAECYRWFAEVFNGCCYASLSRAFLAKESMSDE